MHQIKQNSKFSGQIIHSSACDGPTQMASDELMLNKVNEENHMSIRFYKWEGIWLSIGYHQKDLPKQWLNLLKKKKINIVRRPSGGGAVLHSGGITYALAWRQPPRKNHKAYREINQWLINCFNELGIPLKFGTQPSVRPSGNCFSTSTVADLVDKDGNKRIGSAQLWRNGHLLQHGEIILNPPVELWKEIFKNEPPPKISNKFSKDYLEELLTNSFISSFSKMQWVHTNFQPNELKEIELLSKSYLIKKPY